MSLTRFTENFTPSIEVHNKFTSSRKLTEAEVRSIEDGTRLTEATRKIMERNPVARLSEKNVYKMPISRYDFKNANGRIYSKQLWENVIKNQSESYVGGLGLADHPEDDKDGSFKEASVVYLGLELNETHIEEDKLVFAECIFVGKYGKLAEEILEAGGRVGFSSSGFGELEESDRCTVNPRTYMLERVADLVLNPSQNVYGKKENVLTKESTMKNNNEDMLKEETHKMVNESSASTAKFSRLEERQFRKDVTQFLSEAVEIKNPAERIGQLEEIKSYFSEGVASDLYEQVTSKIKEAEAEINKSIDEYAKIKDTFDVDSTEDIKEGLSKLAVDTKYYEKTAEEWKNIAKTLQEVNKKLKATLETRPTPQAYREALQDAKALKIEVNELTEAFKAKMEEAKEVVLAQKESNKNLIEELRISHEKTDKLVETIRKYKEHTLSLKETISEYEATIRNHNSKITEEQAKRDTIDIAPKKASPTMFQGFNESDKVREYYSDLYARHGKDISMYEDAICGAKTVKEAMRTYNRILSEMGRTQTTKISEAIPVQERQRIIESQTGTKIRTQTTRFESRLPEGWE